jgi:serine/threonine-protein kinase
MVRMCLSCRRNVREAQDRCPTCGGSLIHREGLDRLRSEPPDVQAGAEEGPLPPEVREARADPSNLFGKFVRVAHLGDGAMGSVWRCYDVELNRWVAIKFVEGLGEPVVAQVVREAQSAALLHHPNIAQVYEVGRFGTLNAIVMQYVDGRELTTQKLPPRLAMELLREVARAVEYAHRSGVIHRDLKPSNILLDRGGKPTVVDFGLAKRADSGGPTLSGKIVGTPEYMSPEQARGETVDARSDVYSLGATLYALLTGRAAFEGSSVLEVLEKVQKQEPARPGDWAEELDRDVETIVLKAMEKDPARRYGSAAEFAGDIDRYLSGEPILARPASLTYRLRKRLVKNKSIMATAGAAVLVLAVAGAILVPQWLEARRRAGVAIESFQNIARRSLEEALALRRQGKNESMSVLLSPMETAYREAIRWAPESPEPEYQMGRMYRALMREDEALRCQNRALAKRPLYAPSLYEKILLQSRGYSRMMQAARAAGEEGETERPGSDLQALKREIFEGCALLDRASPAPSPEEMTAARGISRYYTGQPSQARSTLEPLARRNPQLEEAWQVLAMACVAEAWTCADLQERRAHFDKAIEYFSRGIENDRGYLPLWTGRSQVRKFVADLAAKLGQDPLPEFQNAESDQTRSLEIDRGYTIGYHRRGLVRWARAWWRFRRGEDPLKDGAQAIEDYTRAIELDGTLAAAWLSRGIAHREMGRYRRGQGQEAQADWDAAERDLTRAIELEPKEASGPCERGSLRRVRDDLKGAAADLARAVELNPEWGFAWYRRGNLRWAMKDLEGARADYDRAVRLQPDFPEAYNNRGLVLEALSERDPAKERELLTAARADLIKALEQGGPAWYHRRTCEKVLSRLLSKLGEH